MRKVLSLAAVLLMLLTLASPVFAATGAFVPSITYKDGPEIVEAEQDGKDVTGCLVVTSLREAKDKTTDIDQKDRDLLWDIYKDLKEDKMQLPLEDNYVVRELVDVSFMKQGCVDANHGHKQWLEQDNTTVEIKFDLGVDKDLELDVLAYVDEEWVKIKSVKNNGDGTVTCVFEDICPVAFCVKNPEDLKPPQTGDSATTDAMLWLGVMVVSFLAVVVLLFNRRKFIG